MDSWTYVLVFDPHECSGTDILVITQPIELKSSLFARLGRSYIEKVSLLKIQTEKLTSDILEYTYSVTSRLQKNSFLSIWHRDATASLDQCSVRHIQTLYLFHNKFCTLTK